MVLSMNFTIKESPRIIYDVNEYTFKKLIKIIKNPLTTLKNIWDTFCYIYLLQYKSIKDIIMYYNIN